MQGMIDFDNPVESTPAPATPDMLTLETSRGEILGQALKALDAEFVTLTETGMITETSTVAYPKGISVTGQGTARIQAETLYRMLETRVRNPSFNVLGTGYGIGNYTRLNKLIKGLGKEYVRIEVNGKVQVRTGNFIATLPSAPAAE